MNILRRKSFEDLMETTEEKKLTKALGAFDITLMGLGIIIGTGIFVLTGIGAAKYAGPGLMLSFVLAAVTCTFVCLAYSELASFLPVSGSSYTYAYASLGAFAFNHPDYVYPEIADRYFQMEGKALGHPLLHRDVCVRNDIDIRRSPSFLIVTGANMAGKSTYLRTVGVNYLLACVGVPVCAESLRVFPAVLVTSLRTSDSLVSHESYFFAELKRLKMIIDRLQRGEQLFIILDEILKGTNSEDKQKGSLALMKQLVRYRSCGIIATHDLVLGTLADEFPDAIENYRFEADIEGDELRFSYRLQPGVARNMNACFLMQKMGITI